MNKRLGFLGTGIMGYAMANRLIDAGHSLTIWNRTPSKCDPLVAKGAIFAATPADVIERSDITFSIVSTPHAAHEICFGEDGVLSAITPEKSYIDMATVDPATSQRIDAAIQAKGGRFLEAPVSGSKSPAEQGTLVILAAGAESLFQEARFAFDILGKKSIFLGKTGQGARMKLVVNMVMGSVMAAFCEGLSLGEKAGLATSDLLSILDAGAISNPMFRSKGPLIQEGTFSPAFPLKHMQKDMRLAIQLGDQLAQPLPTSAASNESFKRARANDFGDLDFASIFRIIHS